ncbi:MAG: fibrobacter succinogenes major paralogous domain-containing protein [Rickettsiales bacterium]|nr:fibrobacter succinogenes major paralogous domain-containing protein [Rickettsiales bacterium]
MEDLVDASGYGPTTATGYTASGYYERDLFIRTDNALTNYDWSSVQNDNLWGNNGTEEDRQGPCATGWHVPTNAEWLGLMRAVCYAGIFSGNGNCAASSWTTNFTTADRDAIVNYLNLPLAGNRNRSSGALALQGSHARYWASTPNGTYAYYLSMLASNLYPQHYNNRAYGFSVRCFKNSTP